jgi:hypothetical protein
LTSRSDRRTIRSSRTIVVQSAVTLAGGPIMKAPMRATGITIGLMPLAPGTALFAVAQQPGAGAMQAAERAGDTKKAAAFAERVLEQTGTADSPRPEIAHARRVLGR